MTESRRIRVFVSSTFRDMIGERDELMTHAWPDLRRFCRERRVELVEVDLRWGIAEEQITRKETLKLCLDEIRACRPFFIGLLGERYGWVPGDDAFTADLREEQPWLRDLHGKSVTELEILHGVLNNPEMAGRAFFYFRDSRFVVPVPADRKSDFTAEDAASAEKQTRLKHLIRQTCAEKNIPLRENYPNPRQLAAFVLDDLKAAIEAQFPIADIPDPLTREARDHEAFAEIRRRTYIGRDDYFQALDRHAAGGDGPLVLLGESGGGKSALVTNWLEHWRAAHPRDFLFQHYIGGTPDSAEHEQMMTRLVGEIKRWTGDPEDLPKTRDDLLRDFPLWLAKARGRADHLGVRCIVVLDALNQLEDRDHARSLGWLPEHPFTGPLRLIVSTLPGEALDAVQKRGWKPLPVEPLSTGERERMIAHYLARFGKKLDPHRQARLAAAPAAANPLYLKILLDELRVTGTHDQLDEKLSGYLAAPVIPALLAQVLARWQRDYERDRPGLVGEALGLVWAARRGLTENELLRLLKPADQAQLPLAVWSPLRAALEDGLVDRAGILNFAHDFLRTAVATMFAPDEAKQGDLRLQLAAFFEAEPITARTCDELPWLLWRTESSARLRACLLDIDRFLLIRKRNREEVRGYWVGLQQERTMGSAYLQAFEDWAARRGASAEVVDAANEIGMFLHVAAVYNEAESLARRALDIAVHGHSQAIATCLYNLGGVLEDTHRHEEAEDMYRRALAIDESSRDGPENPNIAATLGALAQVLQHTDRPNEAEMFIRRALEIDQRILGPEHPDVARDLNNLAELLRITNRLGDAEPLLLQALDICEKYFGPHHPTIATILNNLALLLQSTNRVAEAESLFRRSLAIREQTLGSEHWEVGSALNNLGHLLKAVNRLAEAEPLMQRALAIEEKVFGPEDPNVAVRLNNLAALMYARNRPAEAVLLQRRAVAILDAFRRENGHDHPNYVAYRHNLESLLAIRSSAGMGCLFMIALSIAFGVLVTQWIR